MNQQEFYTKMMGYTFSPSCISDSPDYVRACDYFLLDTIDGIEYYTPNDEEWGAIVAVSHEHKLAHDTQFFEMDDMEDPEGDYCQVVDDGKIMCRFEAGLT